MRKLSYALVAFGFFSLSGCASIYQTMVGPEVESPVISAEKQIDLVGSLFAGREAQLYLDASQRPPAYSTNFMANQDQHLVATGGLSYSLKGVSFSGGLLGANTLVEGLWIGGKLQLIGRQSLFLDSPFYLSAWTRGGGQEGEDEGDHNGDFFGSPGYPWKATRTGAFFNGGVSLGYEVAPWLAAYVGYGKGRAMAKGFVEHSVGGGGSSPAAEYTNSFNASMTSWGGGVQFIWPQTRITVSMQNLRTEVGGASVIGREAAVALDLRIGGPRDSDESSSSP